MRVASALLLVALLVPGCVVGDGQESIDSAELSRVVLQPGDLGGDWIRFDEGRQARADAPPGGRADPGRFGRENGWKARYRRSATSGPLIVESRADLFGGDDGAAQDFALLRAEASGEPVEAPEIGQETVATTFLQGGVRFYTVAWRHDNVTASVLVSGFARSLALDDAVALARAQERRLAAAS